jgi:colanic acid biosynthesis glycosyl transferase WcaI
MTDPPIIGLAALLAGKRADAPLVMAFQDLFPEVAALLPDFHSTTVNHALQRINEFLVQRAAANVAIGETMKRRLVENKGAPADRTVVIPNWADTSAIVPGTKTNAFSTAHGFADKFVVMHSGNLGLSQSLETLVEAAARLRHIPDLIWVFQGEGVKKHELLAQVEALGLSNVRFLPFAPKETLSDSFAAADVFVVSLQAGLAGYIVPSKLYGILSAGRPYVAAVEEQCEVAAITVAGQCGLVAKPGNAVALAEQIETFYRDRELTRRCGQNARQLALAGDRRVQVSRYAELFRLVTRSPATSVAVNATDTDVAHAGEHR